ncbi:MAG: hypothetical protein JXM69_00965 [Anaerolineae bacterium]|nr:hypothetical protein [Anaerolineae bacterium]
MMNQTDPSFDVKTDAEYKALWQTCGPIEVKMVEKCGQCVHNLHDTFYYETPYKKPQGICTALLHVLDLYAWRVALGFPSWQADDRHTYRIHCPDATGTVWEMRKVASK